MLNPLFCWRSRILMNSYLLIVCIIFSFYRQRSENFTASETCILSGAYNYNFDKVSIWRFVEVYGCYDSQNGSYLVEQIFQQLFGILYSLHIATVAFINVERTSLGIRKTTYSFQVFVFPNGYVFYVLGFGHS